MNHRYENFSIELDCKPGYPRPSDLIESVLEGTGLEVSDFDTSPPFFGEQVWVLKKSANKDTNFIWAKPIFEERITKLYNQKLIRYGSW